MSLVVTPFYAGLLGLYFFYLSVQVVKQRRLNRVSIGAGKSRELERAIRVQGNFSEYTPLTLLLVAFAEILGAPDWSIHAMALILIAGRLMHAYGLGQEPDNFKFRSWGMYFTAAVLIAAALASIGLALQAMLT